MEPSLPQMMVFTAVAVFLSYVILKVLSGKTPLSEANWLYFTLITWTVGLAVFHFASRSLVSLLVGVSIGAVISSLTINWYEKMFHSGHQKPKANTETHHTSGQSDASGRDDGSTQ